jgi:hypothetical protein
MTNQHQATPEQWNLLQRQGETLGSAESIALLELRARIEALEATHHVHVNTSHLTDAERKRIREELARPAAWRPLKVAIETTYGDAKPVPLFTAEEVARIVAPISPAEEDTLIQRAHTALPTPEATNA